MTNRKKLGIWMDHSRANLMDMNNESAGNTTIENGYTHGDKQETLNKSEHTLHNKEQQLMAVYYNQIGDAIKSYDYVLLFGPTKAKTELLNALRSDLAYSKIEIIVKDADKMTDNQQRAFAREFFASPL